MGDQERTKSHFFVFTEREATRRGLCEQCEAFRVPFSHSSFASPAIQLTVRQPTIYQFHALGHGTRT